MSELKPCPFCGGEARAWNTPHVGGLHNCAVLDAFGVAVECSECHATTIGYMSEERAIAAWNTRAVESASGLVYIPSFRDNGEFPEHIWASLNGEVVGYVRERTCRNTGKSRVFQCSECGFGLWDVYMDDEMEWDASFCDFPPYCPKCGARVERGDV